MAKIIYGVLAAFAIELSIFLFGGSDIANSSLFGLLRDPSNITSSPLYTVILGAMIIIGATTIIIGTFFNINIYGVYSSVAVIFLSFAVVIADFWRFLNGQLVSIFPVSQSSIIATIIVAPLLIAYIIMTLNYIRSND